MNDAHHGAGVPFGRYLIRRRLAQGGMGEVFLADQLGPLGPVRPVALKRMRPQLSADEGVARLFLEEMTVAAQLNHPNIATTYDFGEAEGEYYLAMEYVEGLALNRILRNIGPLPLEAATYIVGRVAEALAFAHDHSGAPVIHQDVSPHNVMISKNGDVKLLDFGIAGAEAALGGQKIRAKLAYASPEQIAGKPPSRRFDIWALGVLLYECLTGQRPFDPDSAEAALALDVTSRLPVADIRPQAAGFETVIARALSRGSDAFENAQEFQEALASVAARLGQQGDARIIVQLAGGPSTEDDGAEITGTGVAAALPAADSESTLILHRDDAHLRRPATPAPLPSPPRRRRFGLPLAMGAGLLIGAIGFVFFVGRPSSGPPARSRLDASVSEAVEVATAETATRTATEVPSIIAAPPVQPAAVTTPPRSKRRRKSSRRARRGRPKEPKRATAPPPPLKREGGFGILSVRTVPWGTIVLDGKTLGEGMVAGKPVAVGVHRLVLTPGEGNLAKIETQVEIRAGVSTTIRADFRTGRIQQQRR